MVEFANIANLRLNFGPGLERAGLLNEERQLRQEQARKTKLKEVDIEDALDLATDPDKDVQEQGLIRLASLQGPAVANSIRQTLERGDQRELDEGARQTTKALKNVLTLQAIKDPGKRATAIRQMGEDPRISRKELDELVQLQGKTPDEQDLELESDRISLTTVDDLIKERTARIKFEREQATANQFEDVLNEKGEVIAQRNIATGEVKKSPLASGVRGGPNEKGTFTKGVSLLAKNPDGTTSVLTPVTDSRSGVTTLQRSPLEGEVVSRTFGETGQQESARKVGQAGATEGTVNEIRAKTIGAVETAKVVNKGRAKRTQDRIVKGIEASGSLPILNRGIELLDSVKTGGLANAQLRAKQAFGIESANEAELSSNLGKAVLSQLRTTFGAAFTENEGQRLARIEAGFGKSTEGNRRLLGQARKIALDAANRGLRQARAQGDTESMQEIQDLIDFRLTPEPEDLSKLSDDEFLKSLK